jgi:RimJ/RimL family protein N-acetyltransferase
VGHPWPLFDLRLRTPRLELRLADDDDLLALLEVAKAGVHDRPQTPFLIPWDEPPSPAMERQFLLHWWQARGSWTPDHWNLALAVCFDGVPIGVQDLFGRDFPRSRTVSTGSWLGLPHHGRGYGTEARAAVLWLAFEELGAVAAESGYLEQDGPSARVSAKLGYQPHGTRRLDAGTDHERLEWRVRVTPETWKRDLVPISVEGMNPCRGLFGEQPMGPDDWVTFQGA